jgi:translocator protein
VTENLLGSAQQNRSRWKPILVAVAAAVAVSVLGGLSTDIGAWYRALNKPSWQPPDWLFGPVWTTIYAFTAAAGVTVWRATHERSQHRWIIGLFVLNAVVNVLWSLLFFRLQRPDWALAEVGFLWGSIVLLIVVFSRWSRTAGWLLLPYLLWVSFASFLNWTIVQLNAPFGAG